MHAKDLVLILKKAAAFRSPFEKGGNFKEINSKLALMPARGEGGYVEMQKEIPSPSTGEGQGGVINRRPLSFNPSRKEGSKDVG